MPKADQKTPGLMSGPVGWVQVLAGTGIAIAGGSFATKPVREFFIRFSEGMLAITNHDQDTVTIGEVFALAILLGGAISGAGRHNGLLQGILVGVGAGVGMIPFVAGDQAKYMPFIIMSALFLAPLGGWFGTTLLPPPPPPRLAPPP
jgi:hypothetical protein